MKILMTLVSAGLLSIALAIPISQAPAGAASSCVTAQRKKPYDPSWSTVCGRQVIAVCDADPDGHKAYAHYWPQWYTDFNTTDYDSYGYTNGQFCNHLDTHSAWGIDRFQICVQYEGCSAWKDAG